MTIRIRESERSDYGRVRDLLEQAGYLPHGFTEQRFGLMVEKCRGNNYVADDNGKVVGTVFSMDNGAFLGYIGSLVVDNEYRRQGVGRELGRAVMKRFDELKISRRFALIRKGNESSVNLLRSLDFEIRDSHYFADMVIE